MAPNAKPPIPRGMVITGTVGPCIVSSKRTNTPTNMAKIPTKPISLSCQVARLSNSHHSTTSIPINKGPKAATIQIIDGPSSTKPGTKRAKIIKPSKMMGIHIRSGL